MQSLREAPKIHLPSSLEFLSPRRPQKQEHNDNSIASSALWVLFIKTEREAVFSNNNPSGRVAEILKESKWISSMRPPGTEVGKRPGGIKNFSVSLNNWHFNVSNGQWGIKMDFKIEFYYNKFDLFAYFNSWLVGMTICSRSLTPI